MTNTELAKQLKRLNRLSRAELSALCDSHRHAAPNAPALEAALTKLNDTNDEAYPTRARRWTR